jgi:hypothetical protein
MIISLPVKIYDKYCQIPFIINITNELLSINPINNENKIYFIVLFSESLGINSIPISFPLYFTIVKNELICDHFYIFQSSTKNNIDFINVLLNKLNKYKLYNNMHVPTLINVLKLNNEVTNINQENLNSFINKNYYRIVKYLNFCITIMNDNTLNISQTSKITQIINLIKQLKISFYGNTFTIEEHLEHINNPKLIKKKRFYFYEKNNKILKVFINENINKEVVAYPSKYKKFINITNFLNILIFNHFNKLFEIVCKVLFKKYPFIINLMIDFINNKTDGLIDYEFNKKNYTYKLFATESSFTKFKNIIDNNTYNLGIFNEEVFNELINNYTYPINYDKRTINENFAKLLYYFLKFNNDINVITINNPKIKSILYNISKIYKSLNAENIISLNNPKIYNDFLLYQIFKILIYNDTFNLFISNSLIKSRFTNNIILLQILNNLSWNTLSKNLSSLKYIISIKDAHKDLILSDGKINKCYNLDNRIKKIIIEPLYMFNYLKKEEDFYKWIIIFKPYITSIYNNMITLDNDDYYILAKILCIYSKIKSQNTENSYYKKLIKYCKNNSRLVLFNDRINIKFKDIFKNININLGYLARDIINEETISISSDIQESIKDTNETIQKLRKKYYKYKGKYLEIKCITDTIY